MATRIYAIRNAEESEIIALVEAKSEAEAYRHVARTSFDVSVATPRECAESGRGGVKLEVAGEATGPVAQMEAEYDETLAAVLAPPALQEKATMMARLIEAPLPNVTILAPPADVHPVFVKEGGIPIPGFNDSIIVHADPEEATK